MYFGKNLKYLTSLKGLNQTKVLDAIGFKRTTWNGYVNEKSFPKFEDLIKIAEYFDISETDLIHADLQNVALNKKQPVLKNSKNVALNVAPSVALNGNNIQKEPCKDCAEKDRYIAGREEVIKIQTAFMEQLNTNIKLLQNQIDQMKYDTQEREQTHVAQRKDRKSA